MQKILILLDKTQVHVTSIVIGWVIRKMLITSSTAYWNKVHLSLDTAAPMPGIIIIAPHNILTVTQKTQK